MNKEPNYHDDGLIELGSVTEVTKGTAPLGLPDDDEGVKIVGGLGVE